MVASCVGFRWHGWNAEHEGSEKEGNVHIIEESRLKSGHPGDMRTLVCKIFRCADSN